MNNSIVVAAAIRNISSIIEPIFQNIRVLTTLFDKVKCVLIESDSYDDTVSAIQKHKHILNCGVSLYSFGSSINQMPNRMQRICKARNIYLDIIEKDYKDFDYLYVMDFNDSNLEPYDKEGIISNFNLAVDWNMVCANQEKMYYDLYALRHDVWMPSNCWNAIGNRPSFMSYEDAHNIFVKSRFLKIDKFHDPIKVNSAFGGSAFIKIKSINGARHEALDEKGEEECEWVSFCKQIGNVYINPKFINMRGYSRHVVMANK